MAVEPVAWLPYTVLPAPNATRGMRSYVAALPGTELLAMGVTSNVLVCNQKEKTFRAFTQHKSDITAVAGHPEGFYVASGDATGVINVFSPSHESLFLQASFELVHQPIRCLAFNHDGSKLLVACENGKSFTINLETKTAAELQGSETAYNSCCYRKFPVDCAFCSESGNIICTDLKGKVHRTIQTGAMINAVVYNKNGKYLIAGGASKCLYVYNNKYEDLHKVENVCQMSIYQLLMVDDYVIGCSGDCLVFVYKLDDATGELTKVSSCVINTEKFPGYGYQITGLAFNKTRNEVTALTLAGIYYAWKLDDLIAGKEASFTLAGLGRPCSFCKRIGDFVYCFASGKAVRYSADFTSSSIINPKKYDECPISTVLDLFEVEGRLFGFTTSSFFRISEKLELEDGEWDAGSPAVAVSLYEGSQFVVGCENEVFLYDAAEGKTVRHLIQKNQLPKGFTSISAFSYSTAQKKFALTLEIKGGSTAKLFLVDDLAEIEKAPKAIEVKSPCCIGFRGADLAVGQRDGIVCYVDGSFQGHEFTNGARDNGTVRGFYFIGDLMYVYGAGDRVVQYDLTELSVKKFKLSKTKFSGVGGVVDNAFVCGGDSVVKPLQW